MEGDPMSDIKLFRMSGQQAVEIPGTAVALEKSLQTQMEQNLETLLGIQFLASEYSTGPKHGGRIDTLGLDENGNPVIIEYKRTTNENVINQGLYYLDWLLDHRAEFELMVMKQLGQEVADAIDWSAPRLLCIAGGYTRYDEHAVQQINRNIELMRYRRFGDELLLLELVNATSAAPATATEGGTAVTYKSVSETLDELNGALADLYEELRAYLLALGDDIQEKTLKYYIAFKRIKNFACLEPHPGKGCITCFVKVDPDSLTLEKGFTRDVRNIGHYGTGDLEIKIHNSDELEKAKSLFLKSYESA
jgi:predicted transport protein